MSRLDRHTLPNRRGFSVLELVVALTIIVLISAAAVTFLIAATKAEAKLTARMEVTNSAENAIEAFRYSSSAADFDLFLLYSGEHYTPADGASETYRAYSKTTPFYQIWLTVDYAENQLEFYAVDTSGKEIYRFNYVQ